MVKQKECRIMSEKQLRDLYSIDLNSNMAIQNKKREQCKFLRKYLKRVSGMSKKLEQQIKSDYIAMGCSNKKMDDYLKKDMQKHKGNNLVFSAMMILGIIGIIVLLFQKGIIKFSWPEKKIS
jgi:hypothetical protein